MLGGPRRSGIWPFLSFALPVERDEWELDESGRYATYLGPARRVVYAAHVVEAHDANDSEYEVHQGADERAQCGCVTQRIVLRVLDLKHGQDSSASTVTEPRVQNKATHESNIIDNTLSIFHSLTSEVTKPPMRA